MGVAILGTPQAIYDYDITGPYAPSTAPAFLWNNPSEAAKGIAGPMSWGPQRVNTSIPRQIVTNVSVGGGAANTQLSYKGVWCRAITGGGVGRTNIRYGGLGVMPITDATGLAPGYTNPSWRRVNRFQWSMAMSVGGLITAEGGMLYAANPGGIVANVQWPSGAATIYFGGFGVIGDGAGEWQWATFGAGPPPTAPTELVDLSATYADAEDWNTFEIVCISGSGSRAASVDLLVNGADILSRNFTDAPVLFGLGPTAGVEVYHYIPTYQSGLGGTVYIGDFHYRMGRFLPDGRELTS